MIPLQTIPKVFDSDTLAKLEHSIKACSSTVDYHDQEGVWKDAGTVAHITHWEWDHPDAGYIRDTLGAVLDPIVGPFVSVKSHILDSRLPWDVHNDYAIECSQSQLTPYCVVMIPLDNTPAHTIFFDQGADYKEFGRYKDEHAPIPNYVPHEIWNGMLGHCRTKDRFYLSVQKVYQWQQGDLLIWDRQQWHASDNYLHNDIKQKRAIILFTSYP
jgi:hypothetical protein